MLGILCTKAQRTELSSTSSCRRCGLGCVDWVWTECGLGVDWVWIGCGLGVDWVWIGCGLGVDCVRIGCGCCFTSHCYASDCVHLGR